MSAIYQLSEAAPGPCTHSPAWPLLVLFCVLSFQPCSVSSPFSSAQCPLLSSLLCVLSFQPCSASFPFSPVHPLCPCLVPAVPCIQAMLLATARPCWLLCCCPQRAGCRAVARGKQWFLSLWSPPWSRGDFLCFMAKHTVLFFSTGPSVLCPDPALPLPSFPGKW